jgi:hypothetical protein
VCSVIRKRNPQNGFIWKPYKQKFALNLKKSEKQMIDKKEAKKQYKQTLQPMGIYQIRNIVNGKIFIGSSKNLNGGLNRNRFQLEQGLHMNKQLQNDYNQFGEGKFSFEVLDYLEPKEDTNYDYTEELKVLEEMWLERLQPYNEKGYNKRKEVN